MLLLIRGCCFVDITATSHYSRSSSLSVTTLSHCHYSHQQSLYQQLLQSHFFTVTSAVIISVTTSQFALRGSPLWGGGPHFGVTSFLKVLFWGHPSLRSHFSCSLLDSHFAATYFAVKTLGHRHSRSSLQDTLHY